MIQHPAEYAGLGNFVWFFGVVEDNVDPLYLGRVRVRCFGWHDANKGQVPTEALPWAQIMMPSTSASVSGVGTSPTGIMTGSWVVGFFLDGDRCQQPMVLGTFHGIPQALASTNQGFNDPTGKFPRTVDEPDTTKLARTDENSAKHPSLKWKKEKRITGISTARRCKVSEAVIPPLASEQYDPGVWDEPVPRGDKPSIYPHNKVQETELGHVVEFDDSPGCKRIHEFHASGTFREIQDDGTRITKLVGSDYEIIAGGKHVHIVGDCDLTVNGTVRLRIDGDLIEEVYGNHFTTVHGSRHTKIVGNDITEIYGSRIDHIETDYTYRVNGTMIGTVDSNSTLNVMGDQSSTVIGDMFENVSGDKTSSSKEFSLLAKDAMKISGASTVSIAAGTSLSLSNLKTVTSTGNISMSAPYGGLSISTASAAAITATAGLTLTSSSVILINGSIVSINP